MIAPTSANSSNVMKDVLAEADEHWGHVSSATIIDDARVAISIAPTGSDSLAPSVKPTASSVSRTWNEMERGREQRNH